VVYLFDVAISTTMAGGDGVDDCDAHMAALLAQGRRSELQPIFSTCITEGLLLSSHLVAFSPVSIAYRLSFLFPVLSIRSSYIQPLFCILEC
jgi:hypothetical protein